jgi:hypothetical protein
MNQLLHIASRFLLAALAAAAAGCGFTDHRMGVQPPGGRLFTLQKAPMVCRCWAPGGVRRSPDLKVGTASAANVVVPRTSGLLSAGWGDVSLQTAAANGGISTIHYADYQVLSILGVYTQATVYVYGE